MDPTYQYFHTFHRPSACCKLCSTLPTMLLCLFPQSPSTAMLKPEWNIPHCPTYPPPCSQLRDTTLCELHQKSPVPPTSNPPCQWGAAGCFSSLLPACLPAMPGFDRSYSSSHNHKPIEDVRKPPFYNHPCFSSNPVMSYTAQEARGFPGAV